MNDISIVKDRILSMHSDALHKVDKLAEISRDYPQIEIETTHILHAGLYSRTILVPQDVIITGVLIKIPTQLIICGHARLFKGDEIIEVRGYSVFAASKHRKQAMLALQDTHMTMIFPTQAKTIEEAESQFTDELDSLLSQSFKNNVIITGE